MAISKLASYFPNLEDSILHRQVLSPLDLERLLGISGGHALHGDGEPMSPLLLEGVFYLLAGVLQA